MGRRVGERRIGDAVSTSPAATDFSRPERFTLMDRVHDRRLRQQDIMRIEFHADLDRLTAEVGEMCANRG